MLIGVADLLDLGGADAALFTINSITGALTLRSPLPTAETPTDAGGNNVYDVTVQVSDGTNTDTQAIAVTVTNVNEPPVITSNGGGVNATVNVAENSTAVTDGDRRPTRMPARRSPTPSPAAPTRPCSPSTPRPAR